MSHCEILKTILEDGRIHLVEELIPLIYGKRRANKSNRLAARIYDLKKRYGYVINSDQIENTNKAAWWYKLDIEKSHVWKNRGKHSEKTKA